MTTLENKAAHDSLAGEGSKLMERGRYVDFWELPDGKLRMVLNRENEKEFRDEIYDLATERGINAAFYEMIEDYTCNGWMIFRNEEIGALTDALIFGKDYEHDGETDALKSVGRVYFNDRYALDNEITILLDKGYYDFSFTD